MPSAPPDQINQLAFAEKNTPPHRNKKTAHKERYLCGRIDWTRTSDLFVPNEAFYQAELQSDNLNG